jgi:hypothetical protein
MPNYIDLPIEDWETIVPDELQIAKAKQFATCLPTSGNTQLVQCGRIRQGNLLMFPPGDEIVIIDTEVDVGPRPAIDIRYTERIAVVFNAMDNRLPWIFALREDFPLTTHRLLFPFVKPVALCLYEQSYDELKPTWRAQLLLERIRTWLSLTAENKLHQDGQPLEALLPMHQGIIILPHDLQPGEQLLVHTASQQGGQLFYVASRKQVVDKPTLFHSIHLQGTPQLHGLLDVIPTNLESLQRFLETAGINCYKAIEGLIKEHGTDQVFLQRQLLIIVELPKTDHAVSRFETDFYAFGTTDTLKHIGLQTGILAKGGGQLATDLSFLGIQPEKAAQHPIHILLPLFQLDRTGAQYLAGYTNADQPNAAIAQIGVGALGSQIVSTLAKSLFGRWHLIDEDALLPHNTVRHYLDRRYVGTPKALALAHELNFVTEDPSFAIGMWDNYLHPLDSNKLNKVLQAAALIIDTSTSIPVARDLAIRTDLKAKRVSIFLNPAGTDLVILAEDQNRQMPLDILEFQYYRHIVRTPGLHHHLTPPGTFRYTKSCRDITSRIPQENVAILAAIAAKQVKQLFTHQYMQMGIWRITPAMGVQAMRIIATGFEQQQHGEWTVIVDQGLISDIGAARRAKLPAETGGVLIGGFDFERKRIYLVDMIPSPKDSIEEPEYYIRGIDGLNEKMQAISAQTAGNLVYAGEWHSHPENYRLKQSDDDHVLFAEMKKDMDALGYPTIMLIAGDNDTFQLYVA